MKDILYEGKSKTIYQGPDNDSLLMSYNDTATAFSGEKKAVLPGKGRLNAAISNLIYNYLSEHGIETHLIKVIDDNFVVVKKAEIIMVEVIIRNIAAGSFSKKYGIPEGSNLKNTVIEFSLKSDKLGDPMINENQITAIGFATKKELDEMTDMAFKINILLEQLFEKTDIKLIDFKLEFGRLGDKIILCDEISPDSCRLWELGSNKKLDKDRFRRDLGEVLESYQEVLRRLSNV